MAEKSVIADLIVKLGADPGDFKTGIDSALTSLTGFSTTTLAISGIAIGAIAAIGAAALAIGVEFDDAFDTIANRTGAVGPELDALQESFKNVFSEVPVSAGEAATAIADLSTRTGLAGPALEALAVQVLNLSRVTGVDVAKAADLATRAFGDWSISTENQAEALDFLFKTSQVTRTDVDKLMQTVVQFGAPLRQLGFDFEEGAALIGKWNAEGVNTETVLSGLRIALATFADAGKNPAEALQQTLDLITALGPGAEATGVAMEVFGKRAGADMAAAILEGRFEIEELVTTLKNSQTTINETAQKADDFGEVMTKLWNSLKALVEPISSLLVGALTKLAEALAWVTNKMVEANTKGIQGWKDTFNAVKNFIGIGTEATAATKKLTEETNKLTPAVASTGKEMGKAKEEAQKFLASLGKTDEATKKAADAAKKLAEEQKKLAETTERKLTKAFAELITEEVIAEQQTAALAGQTNALQVAFEGVAQPIVNIGGAMNGFGASAKDLNKVLDLTVSQIEKTKIPADDLGGSFKALGIESQELKDKKLADLGAALNEIRIAYEQGKIPLDQYRAAQAAYTKEVGDMNGATAKTNLFKDSLTQVSTVLTDLGANLVGSFGAALNTGIKPIDDMKDAVLRLVSEQVLGALSKHLKGLIDLIPGLGSFGKTLGGIFGGGASAVGGVAGEVGGAASGGGAATGAVGAAAGGATALIGAIAGVGTLISSVIGNFQSAKMETTLNAIEHNTRYSMMFLGERSDGGILGVSFRILEQLEFGNLVKATEDFRNKFWDYGIPELRAINTNTAILEPASKLAGDHFEGMLDRLDRIERNTRFLEPIEQNTRAALSRGTGAQLSELKTAIERNTGGIATTISKVK